MIKNCITTLLILSTLITPVEAGFWINQKVQHPFLPYYKDGVSQGNVVFSTWSEISGMTTTKKAANSNHVWAISDNIINPVRMVAIDTRDGSLDGEWTLTGSLGADIECIASAVVKGVPTLWIGDIGDNSAARTTVNLYRFTEPTITGGNGSLASGTDFATTTIAFPASPTGEGGTARRDAESCFADPATGTLYIISKRTTQSQVFSLAYAETYVGTQTLVSEGDMFQIASSSQANNTNNGRAVSAEISPDGKEILVKNYEDIFSFACKYGQTIFECLSNTPTTVQGYVGGGFLSSSPNSEPQGESVAFSYDGQNIFTTSENNTTFDSGLTSLPFFKYERIAKPYTEVSFQVGTNGYLAASSSDTFIQSLLANRGIASSSDTTFIADFNSATDERVGLLKFDTSAIPVTSKVVGCELQVYINTEGSVVQIHPMTQSWSNASTFTSLGGLPATSTALTRVGDYAGRTGTTTIMLPAATCQGWVDTPATNQGLIFYHIIDGNGFQFRSNEFAVVVNRPKLTVRYITK